MLGIDMEVTTRREARIDNSCSVVIEMAIMPKPTRTPVPTRDLPAHSHSRRARSAPQSTVETTPQSRDIGTAAKDPFEKELAIAVLAPRGRDAELTCTMLSERGLAAIRCREIDEVIGWVERGVGALVIGAEVLDRSAVDKLISLLDAQEQWSDVPLIIVTNDTDTREGLRTAAGSGEAAGDESKSASGSGDRAHESNGKHPRAAERYADASRPRLDIRQLARRPNVTLLCRPLRLETFLSVMRTALQSRRRQYQVRDLLRSLKGLNKHLQDRAGQLQKLAMDLTKAEARERYRLADILHNDLQQILVGAQLQLGLVFDGANRAVQFEKLQDVKVLLVRAIARSRNLAHELNMPGNGEGDLLSSLKAVCDQVRELYCLDIELRCDENVDCNDDDIKCFVLRTTQELLLNVVKHACTQKAGVEIRQFADQLRWTIWDQGAGFRYDESDESAGTMGLGLTDIRDRVRALAGTFDVQSRPGQGTRVSLSVSYCNSRSAVLEKPGSELGVEPAAVQESELNGKSRKIRVLLVDDHSVMRQGVRAMLGNYPDIEIVAEANNGLEAVELAKELNPDAVIMDVAMPEMNGIEATRRIKELMPHIRIVGLSMYERDDMAAKMVRAGAEAYVYKGDPGDLLVAAIQAH